MFAVYQRSEGFGFSEEAPLYETFEQAEVCAKEWAEDALRDCAYNDEIVIAELSWSAAYVVVPPTLKRVENRVE